MAKAIQLLKRGAELVRAKRWREAVEVYLQGTEKDPTDRRCWLGLGVCLLRVGNFGMSHIALQRAERMGHPRASRALSWLEEAKRRATRAEGALAAAVPAKTVRPPAEKRVPEEAPPPRPAVLPEGEKLDLGRQIPIMLVEPIEPDREAITKAIQGNIKNAEVDAAPYTISCADTLSSKVYQDVAVLDWDADPSAAAGLVQILKLKRPEMQIVCLTEEWDPAKCATILEMGADYHLVKEPHFASVIPFIIAQLERRDTAVIRRHETQEGRGRAERWPDFLNAVGNPIMLVDTDYKILEANRAAMTEFGRKETELISQRYPTVLYGGGEPPESCPLLQVLEREKPASGEIYHADTQKAFQVQAWPVLSDTGRVSSVIALLGEETAPGRAESGVPSEAARWGSVLDQGVDKLQCGIVVLDAEGRVTWLNSLAADFLCADKESLVGRDYVEVLSQCLGDVMETPQTFIDMLVNAHLMGESLKDHALRLGTREEGDTLKYWSTPVEGGAPSVRRVEHYYPAEQVAGGESAAQAVGSLKDPIIEAVRDMLFTTNDQGNIIWSNPAAAATTGYSGEDLRGMAVSDLAAPEAREKARKLLQRTLTAGASVSGEEIAMVRADGKRRWAELSLLPLRDEKGEKLHGAQGVLRDITERRMTEAIRDILAGSGGP